MKAEKKGYAEVLGEAEKHEEKENNALEHAEKALEALESGQHEFGHTLTKAAHSVSKHAQESHKSPHPHEAVQCHKMGHKCHGMARDYHATHGQFEVSHHHHKAAMAHHAHAHGSAR